MPCLRELQTLVARIACTALLAACAATSGGADGAKLALVIGNAEYENAQRLRNPVNDATDMCAALRKLGFKTLCHTNVRDRAEFDARIKEYVDQLVPGGVGVFYYSGHGVQVGSANFLIPTRVQPRSVADDPLRVLYGVGDMFKLLDHKRTRFQLVILDACRTDLFAGGASGAGGTSGGKGPDVAARSTLIRALESKQRVGSGLAPITHAPSETIVFYATADNEAASDGKGSNGPLTEHILKHIGSKGLKVEDFFKRVTLGVVTDTTNRDGKRQTPFTYGSFSGEFCFAGCWEPTDGVVPPVN